MDKEIIDLLITVVFLGAPAFFIFAVVFGDH